MAKDKIAERWRKNAARQELKQHDPYLIQMFGGTDNGCRKAIVEAGIKHKKGKR